MAGVGTSKEDKRRKRRSLPHEKKPQADKARAKAKYKKYLKRALPPQLRKPGKPTGRTLADVLKKEKKKP